MLAMPLTVLQGMIWVVQAAGELLTPEAVGQAGGLIVAAVLTIRVTLSGAVKRLDRMDRRFDGVERKLDDVGERVARLEGRHDAD